ncbi:hypothetical protein LMG10661_01621 [Ralstonia syzygii subsp. syzygii]|nr:hypothetical protein LMG10661_01621 [Ralstonia syzygii subsp. syzygii]
MSGSYADFGPTLAAEKLRERHGIDLVPLHRGYDGLSEVGTG